jgi:hypothetical protein
MGALIRIMCGLPKDESGISQILKKHTSEVWKQQKQKQKKKKTQKSKQNFVWTQLQGCLKTLKRLN